MEQRTRLTIDSYFRLLLRQSNHVDQPILQRILNILLK